MTFNAYKFDPNNFNSKITTLPTKSNNMKSSSMRIQIEHDYLHFLSKNLQQADLFCFDKKSYRFLGMINNFIF